MSIQLNDFAKQPKTLMKSAAPLDLFPVPNKNQALVVVRISDSESRIDTIDLQTGLQLASILLPAYVERVYSGPEGFKRVVSGSDRDGDFIGILDTQSGNFNEPDLLRGYQMQSGWLNPKWIFAYAEDSYEPWSDYLPIYGIEGNTGKIHENQIDELPYTDNTFQQFSDDGRYYLLLAELEMGAKGFVVRDLGGNPSLVLGKGDSFGAVFSPEDCWIAYSSYQEFDPHPSNRISVLPVTGGTPKKIGEGTRPIWIMN
jgi:hypothetical protein